MAFNISYTFEAQDKFSRVARRVNNSIRKVTSRIGKLKSASARASRGIANFASKLGGLKTAIAALGAGVILKKIVDFGTGFQDAMADLSSITGIAGSQLNELQADARLLSREFITSSGDIVKAFKLVASANSDLIKVEGGIKDVTRGILLLKNAAGIELEEAAIAVTNSMNQFGASAKEANRFVNVLAAGSKIGASEISETAVAVLKSGTAASAVGVSFEELNGLIQVLAKNGIKAEVAGTGLKTALIRLASLGVDRLNPKIVGINKVLENLQAMNLTTAQSSKLFGLEAFAIGQILTNNVGLVKRWTSQITGTNVASEQAAIRMKTFSNRIKELGFLIKDKIIDLFFRLEPQLREVTAEFVNFIESIDVKDLEGLVEVFNGLFFILKGVAKVAKVIATIFKSRVLTGLVGGAAVGARLGGVPGAVIGGLTGAVSGGFEALEASLEAGKAPVSADFSRGRSDINVNINAPAGVVESVKTKSEGMSTLKVGQNLRMAPSGAF